MKAVFYTNKGFVRPGNEDALYVGGRAIFGTDMLEPSLLELGEGREMVCAIDGLGGHAGGTVAAQITAQAFQAFQDGKELEDKNWLDAILEKATADMLTEVRRDRELVMMGTTLAGAVIDRVKKTVFAYNVGDCRFYRFRDGHLEKLTHDHSKVQELVDEGFITEEEMRTSDWKDIVRMAIIADPFYISEEFFSQECPLQDGDKFFACSDGVWEALPKDEIEKTLANDDILAACTELQKKLFSAECQDNVSFVFVA